MDAVKRMEVVDRVQEALEAVKEPEERKVAAELDDEEILSELKQNSIKLIACFVEEVEGLLEAKKEEPMIGKTAGFTSMLSTFVKGYKDTATLLMTVLKYIKSEQVGTSSTAELVQLRERLRVLETDIVVVAERYPAIRNLLTVNHPEEVSPVEVESF